MAQLLLLLVAIVLTAGTALFVAAEFSLVALDRPSVQRAVDRGDRRAKPVLSSLRQLSTQLSAAQVGITLTTLVVGFLAQPSIGALLAGPLEGLGLPDGVSQTIGTTLALIIVTAFSMVFGELLPQFMGISVPLATARVVALPVRVFAILVKPLIIILNGSANRVLKLVGITPQEELSGARTPQELASLVRRSAQQGTLEESTARRLTRSLGFGDQTAADVMTPRVRGTAIERTASAADVITVARRTGYSRFPVIGTDWDDLVGMVHVKKAIAVPHDQRSEVLVSELMVQQVLVPETIGLDALLRQLRAAGLQMAIVIDEYGGTSGVVTLEDVIEEIVGEVSDEHDRAHSTGRRLTDGTWSIPGLWRPDEVRERLGAEIWDSPDYETVGGYLMSVQRQIPQVGDEVAIPGWILRVSRMEGRRVDKVLFIPDPRADPSDPTEAPRRGDQG